MLFSKHNRSSISSPYHVGGLYQDRLIDCLYTNNLSFQSILQAQSLIESNEIA